MTRLESSVLINKPAKDIFAFINTPENHPKFVPGMLEFNKTSPGPLGQVGATARGVRKFLGRTMELPYEIVEYEPNSKLGMKGVMGLIRFKDGYVLDPMGNSTRVNFWLEPVLSGLLKLASPLVALVGKTHANETLANLKKAVEAAP
jgi:carbon monoxide dehydrogenase subunit G